MVWYVRPLVRNYFRKLLAIDVDRHSVTDKVTLSVTYATTWNCGPCVSDCGLTVGGDVSLVLPNENGRLCVMCVMYLIRLMKVYILYIYTVVCIVLG